MLELKSASWGEGIVEFTYLIVIVKYIEIL